MHYTNPGLVNWPAITFKKIGENLRTVCFKKCTSCSITSSKVQNAATFNTKVIPATMSFSAY